MNATRPTREQTRQIKPLVRDLAAKRTVAEVLREKVDAIQRAVLAESCYLNRYEQLNHERITEPKSAWMMSDAQFPAYLAIVRERVEAAGMHAAPECCPALVAEHELCKAEHALIEATAAWFGVTADAINCSLDLRKKWIANVASLALAA